MLVCPTDGLHLRPALHNHACVLQDAEWPIFNDYSINRTVDGKLSRVMTSAEFAEDPSQGSSLTMVFDEAVDEPLTSSSQADPGRQCAQCDVIQLCSDDPRFFDACKATLSAVLESAAEKLSPIA